MSLVSDTHGDFSRFYKLNSTVPEGETWGVIILGDAGLNFWLNKTDKKNKYRVCNKYPKLRFYLVRGNHEERPENIAGIDIWFDEDVKRDVLVEPDYPNIRYLKDGCDYEFGKYYTIVIGGAYSVDKEYRLERAAAGGYAGWFEEEQLTQKERDFISWKVKEDGPFDLVLTHTCPWSWEPRDLFLGFIDQSKVDDSMEIWMDQLKETFNWKVWLCGHFHDDRTLAPHAEMLSLNIKNLDDIMEYWKDE